VRVPGSSALAGCGLALLALAWPGAPARAFELRSVELERDGSSYMVRIEAVFVVPQEKLIAVLSDYERIHELHPRLLESRSLGEVGPATQEVYTRFKGCVAWFCRTLNRVEHIRAEADALLATDVPKRGAFVEGVTEWRFAPADGGTELSYLARFEPDFFVPPVIGPPLLLQSLEQMIIETMVEAERRAAEARD
jgi:hypothetical protein